jgi:hypothetical protein
VEVLVLPRYPFLAILPAVIVVASCTESDVTTPVETLRPMFDANAPPTSGPNIVRGVPLAVGVGGVPGTDMVLVAGFGESITVANCNTPENIPLSGDLNQQWVSTPSGREQFTTPHQEAEVIVYQFEGALSSLCDLVGAPVLATGIASATWVEHNFPPPGDLGPGASNFRITFHGVLDLTAGGQARVFAGFNYVVKDGEIARFKEFVRLTPI